MLTAGLGKTGLGSATAPAIANAAQPTAAELRRLAIWSKLSRARRHDGERRLWTLLGGRTSI
ncbi:3-hydroxybutyrate oligomer hydrolase family protein [Paraburkholderia dipogonis]|uniref:3-hydroxybutyrate oligomer hydrolase family protein n=1 Tax=Paraburkholderia dipogonis TaxID=1211383 RepID=UPI0035E7EE3A